MGTRVHGAASGPEATERLVALGRLTAFIAHEIANTLTPLLDGHRVVGQLIDEGDSTEALVVLAEVQEVARRIDGLMRALLRFHRGERAHGPVDVNSVVLDALALTMPRLRDVYVRKHLDATHTVGGDSMLLCQVLVNLLLNAGDALEYCAHIKSISIHTRDDVDHVAIEVVDNGIGIPDHLTPQVFEAGVTSKGPDRGSGLGLAVTREIVQAHGGSIELQSRSGDGTRVRVRLPVVADAEVAVAHQPWRRLA